MKRQFAGAFLVCWGFIVILDGSILLGALLMFIGALLMV